MRLSNTSVKLLALVTILAFTNSAAADWPQWRGPNRDALVTDAALPSTWPKALKEEWRVTVGLGHASPVMSNGRLYVFARQGEEEVLLCLDAVSGKEIWRSSQPAAYEMHEAAKGHGKGPKSTPVVSGGSICTFGISGIISCHDTRTGKLKWRREFSKLYPKTSPLFGTAMSPVIDNGLLIAHVGGHDKGALTAFDVESGEVKWANDADGPAYASPIIVTLAGVRQVVTFMQKDVVGIDAASGKTLWKIPAKSQYDENAVTAVSYKDMVVFSREGQGLTAIRLERDGATLVPKEVWNNKENQLYMNTPVVQGNTLYGLSARQKGQFFAIDADTGKTIWQSPGRMGENAAVLNLGNKALLMLTNEAKLIVHPNAAKSYMPAAEYSVASSPTWAHPLVLGRRILVKDDSTLISWSVN